MGLTFPAISGCRAGSCVTMVPVQPGGIRDLVWIDPPGVLMAAEPILESVITCPHCGHSVIETTPYPYCGET